MIPLETRRLWQTDRLFAVGILVCFCTLAFAVGCDGKANEATQTTSVQRDVAGQAAEKATHPLSVIGPCPTPGIIPVKNENGNYGEIYFGRYKVELLGTVLCDSKGQEFQEAKGQFYIGGNLDLLITTGPVSKISEGAVEITVDGSPKAFQLTPQTVTCGFAKVVAGKMATVTSHAKSAALSLRSGTMAWANGPAHYDCTD